MGWQRCDEKTAHRAVFSFLAVDVVTAWLCTMTSLPKIVTTRDFVGHVMPIDTQYFAVEKQQHSQTPGSACRRHLRIGRQAGEERLDARLAHLRRMALAAGREEAPYPAQIGLLGAQAVCRTRRRSRLIQRLRPDRAVTPPSPRDVIHTPAQQLGNTTSIDVRLGTGDQVSD